MIKTIAVAHRNPALTHEQFNQYWLEKHARLAINIMPGIKKYVQNHFITLPGQEFQGDGVVEMWYDDLDSMRKSMEVARASKELEADTKNFCSLVGKGGFWIVEEKVILDKMGK